ncbi:MAG TPA: dTDP-glucose 4,6-dehydratase [bacterium]|nr:dTDP-glucose 4,6-dehydratase [bacterium]
MSKRTTEAGRVLLTGGCGFIGSHLVERLIAEGYAVLNLDLLTYAGNPENVASVEAHPAYRFVQADICDGAAFGALLAEWHPDVVFNLAAESHVDRSIDDAAPFLSTNILGVHALLEASLAHWRTLGADAQAAFRFIQMSTDEVYGSIAEGEFTEASSYQPNSPYAASKAAGDHLTRAYQVTFGLPTLIVHASNTYGPRQYPEKMIPHMITCALNDRALPVYGQGMQVRDWMYVEDLAGGLARVVAQGRPSAIYNFSGGQERQNIDTVRGICRLLDRLAPGEQPREAAIVFVTDRPGHDFRYAMSHARVSTELGWTPQTGFAEGLERTVGWYLEHLDWIEQVQGRGYRQERIGRGR